MPDPQAPRFIPVEDATREEIIAALGSVFLWADQKRNFEKQLYWNRCNALLSEMKAAMDEAEIHQGKDREKWWAAHKKWEKAHNKLRKLQD